MGFYQKRVLPHLIDLGMRQKQLEPLRAKLLGQAHGRVLEVGIGSGLNLPFYPRDLNLLLAIDPSPELLAMARKNATWVHFATEFAEGSAEDIPLDDGAIDQVVMTWTLCSVGDPARALAEIRRVLRPGGALLFVEHGRAPDPRTRRWQDRITPVWRKFTGGCHLNRPIAELIEDSGLRLGEVETGHLVGGPKIATFHYRGWASG